jgi:hypothetical protein
MPRDYNNVYLVGTKTIDSTHWIIDQKPFSSEKDAETEAEARTIKSGVDHYVFAPASCYTQDRVTATKNYFA